MEIATRTLVIMIILIIIAAVVILFTVLYSKSSQNTLNIIKGISDKFSILGGKQ